MFINHKALTATAAVAALSACGGTQTPMMPPMIPQPVVVQPFSAAIGPSVVTAEVDDTTGDVALSLRGIPIGGVQDDSQDMGLLGGLQLMSDVGAAPDNTPVPPIPTRQMYMFHAHTDGSLVAMLATSGGTLNENSGQFYERRVETTLPVTGTATFQGGYAANIMQVDAAGNERGVFGAITGAVALNASFEDMTISGEITDRALYRRAQDAASVTDIPTDVMLEETAIDAMGRFMGTSTGGVLSPTTNPSAWNDDAGAYEGAISGADAGEAIGAFSLTHTDQTALTYPERGIFIAAD